MDVYYSIFPRGLGRGGDVNKRAQAYLSEDDDVAICSLCGEPTDDGDELCANCFREQHNEDDARCEDAYYKNEQIRAINGRLQ